jgi:hypothetical protein
MPRIYIYQCIMFVRKNIELFDRNYDRHNHHIRHCDNLSMFQHSKATYEMSPKYRMVHIYKLPFDIKFLESFSCFKKAVFNLLLKLNLYIMYWPHAFACYYVNMYIYWLTYSMFFVTYRINKFSNFLSNWLLFSNITLWSYALGHATGEQATQPYIPMWGDSIT